MKRILTGSLISFCIVMGSILLLIPFLSAVGGYDTAETTYHLPTHALLIALIFTTVISTVLILDKLNK